MNKICSKCGKEWPESSKPYQFGICFECGGELVEKESSDKEAGFSVKMDGSAVNGGIHRTDSHNVDSHDIHTTTNNTTHNVTNYVQQAPKSPEETIRTRKYEFRLFCEQIIQKGGLLPFDGKRILDEKMFQLGLERDEGEPIIESVRRNKRRSSSELTPLARIKLDSAKLNIKTNAPNLLRSLNELKAQSLIFDNEELHFYFNLLLSALDPKQCVERYESRKADSYWMAFWTYLAYLKLGQSENAEMTLASLSNFDEMPQGNLILLDAAGRINEIIGNEDAKESQLMLLREMADESSDLLEDFKDSLIAIYSNKMDKPDFYAKNFSLGVDTLKSLRQETLKSAAKKKAGTPAPALTPITPSEVIKRYGNKFGDLAEIPEKDWPEAYAAISGAAKTNHPAALFLMSEMLRNGWGVKQDVITAWDYVKRSSSAGFRHAGVIMGAYYLYGQGVRKDLDEAGRRLMSAENDNPRVLFLRGELFAARSADLQAKIWYQKAAAAGSVQAKEKLGLVESGLSGKTKTSVKATGEIERIWIENDVSVQGLKGAYVLREFTVQGMKSRSILVRDTYFWSAGSKLLSADDRFKASDGQLMASESSRPDFEDSRWESFRLFIPYSAFPLKRDGQFALKLKVSVHHGSNNGIITEKTADIIFSKKGMKYSLNLK